MMDNVKVPDGEELEQLFAAIAVAVGYVERVEAGDEGHHVVNVTVSEAFPKLSWQERENEKCVLAALLRPHMVRHHNGRQPEIRIREL